PAAADDAAAECLLGGETAIVDAQPARLDGTLDHDRDLVDVERLREVVVGALLHRGDRDALRAVGGEQDDGQRRSAGADLRHQLETIRAGHGEVREHGLDVVELLERLAARARGDHAVTALGEDLGQRVQNCGLVVDEQDRAHARASTNAARAAGSGAAATGLPGSVMVAVVPWPTVLAYASVPPC